MTSRSKIDPSTIPDSAWEFEGYSPCGTKRYSRVWIDKEAGTYIRRSEFVPQDELKAMNREQLNDSYGKRFGDGRVIARIPLNHLYQEVVPYLQQGDKDHLKWWLNRDENQVWRNFRGKV